MKLRDILREIESVHAAQRFDTRFQAQDLMTDAEKAELARRYEVLKKSASTLKDAAVMTLDLKRQVYFHPEKGSNVPLEARESNGDMIWTVIRNGVIKTIFARRGTQGFDYWEDPKRGNMHPDNLYVMTPDLQLKHIKYDAWETTKDALRRLTENGTGGATMNLQDMAKHKKKLARLNKVMAKQGDAMIPYPNLKKTVMGVPWKQLLKKYPMPKKKVNEQAISYSAVVLDEASRKELLSKIQVPNGWEKLAHHMTINMGPLKDKSLLGNQITLRVVAMASNDKVIAVQVETEVSSYNQTKHITVGVNRGDGGKPRMSKDLTNWKSIKPFTVKGTVQEL